MNVILVLAGRELRDALRNRWIVAAVLCLGGLAAVLALVGSAPGGTVKVAPLAVAVANLSSLSVYLLPLLALMLSFDALVGEAERGTLPLLLTYPVARWQVIVGKFCGHVAILGIAVLLGYGGAGALTAVRAESMTGWSGYLVMMAASLALGAVFLALGYVVSAIARERAAAVGAAMGVWLLFVVLYDLALLGVLLLDEGQVLSPELFGWLMLANPTDAYRIFNLASIDAVSAVTGMVGLADGAGLGPVHLTASLLLWTAAPLLLATAIFHRQEV
jgi:Cu-processing system permease protein